MRALTDLKPSGGDAVEVHLKLMLLSMLLFGGHLERGEPHVPAGDPQKLAGTSAMFLTYQCIQMMWTIAVEFCRI